VKELLFVDVVEIFVFVTIMDSMNVQGVGIVRIIFVGVERLYPMENIV
jgi:hypothetical protein